MDGSNQVHTHKTTIGPWRTSFALSFFLFYIKQPFNQQKKNNPKKKITQKHHTRHILSFNSVLRFALIDTVPFRSDLSLSFALLPYIFSLAASVSFFFPSFHCRFHTTQNNTTNISTLISLAFQIIKKNEKTPPYHYVVAPSCLDFSWLRAEKA